MYVPAPFQEHRREILLAAIEARTLGALVTAGAGGIRVSHLPFAIAGRAGEEVLVAHLARANPQWRDIAAGAQAVASFLLDDAYISPSWYPSKAETGKVVPTWNYVAVEARGAVELVEDAPALRTHVDELTARHEAGRPAPWSTADAPVDFTAALLSAIVGIRLHVSELTGAWKLGQNKRAPDRAGAADGLAAEVRTQALAAMMRAG